MNEGTIKWFEWRKGTQEAAPNEQDRDGDRPSRDRR